MTFKITALYKFFVIDDTEDFKNRLKELCNQHHVTGMLIVAGEGLNGTIAATSSDMDQFLPVFYQLNPELAGLEIKFSYSETQPFYRMRVCVKKEIVTLGVEDYHVHESDKIVDVDPQEWNDVISREDVLLVDTRNDYEVALGTFEGAIDPKTKSFKEFPEFVRQLEASSLVESSGKKSLAMFCTGGIRCDKVAALVADTSEYDHIYRLKGGILKYLEDITDSDSKWNGECFVFDQRVTVKHGLIAGNCELCRGCRHPLTEMDREREDFHEGVHCRYCIDVLSEDQKKAAAERHLQMELSKKRNQKHLGYDHNARKNPVKCAP
jgi:UPF0176 protein